MTTFRRVSPGAGLLLGVLLAGHDASAQKSVQEEELKIRLRAEVQGPTAIRFTLTGVERPSGAEAYRLTDGQGREIPIAEILPNTASESLVVPEVSLDPMRVHYLEIPRLGLRTLVQRLPLFRNLYSSKPLGAVVSYDGGETTFRIFSPRALGVLLYLYEGKDDTPGEAVRVVALTGAGISTESGIPDFRGPQGVWTKNPEAEKMATLQHYMSDPEVRRRAWKNRLASAAWAAKPNAGHRALVELERFGKLATIITQTVDGLHQKAGTSPEIVVEIHGTLLEVMCMRCGERAPMERALERVRAGEEDPPCRHAESFRQRKIYACRSRQNNALDCLRHR